MGDGQNGMKNLNPVRTKEEARERGRLGGIKSGEARRAKKTMRETAKMLMQMKVVGETNKKNLERFGIDKNDQNYQTAVVVRLLQKALVEGDTQSIRLIGELTGELGANAFEGILSDDIVDMKYPQICIPSNGRDEVKDSALKPQAGPQTMFMTTSADICVYGGAAGGGKTFALLLEGLRHKDVNGFGAVIFRRNYTQITNQGGLWDASHKIYDQVEGAVARSTPKLHWEFGTSSKLTFAHIGGEQDLSSWQGSEIAYEGFDELTHFSKHEFLYMLSRNRSTCGIKPYVRATCNPDADSWVAKFIEWWIDQDTGYPIPERSGRIRYMTIVDDEFQFADTPEELEEKYGKRPEECKSVTFIASKLSDNKVLMKADPSYMANLKSMTEVDRERLLNGNWKIRPSAGAYFQRTQVEVLQALPNDIVYFCRAWDLAATDQKEDDDADSTACCLMGKRKDGRYVVIDVKNVQIKAGDVEKFVVNTSRTDRATYGALYEVHLPQDPGQAGKAQAKRYIGLLAGMNVKTDPVGGNKEVRATPFAAQWQNGNVQVLAGEWNDMYFSQLEMFPDAKHDDMVDASSDAFLELTEMKFDIDSLL